MTEKLSLASIRLIFWCMFIMMSSYTHQYEPSEMRVRGESADERILRTEWKTESSKFRKTISGCKMHLRSYSWNFWKCSVASERRLHLTDLTIRTPHSSLDFNTYILRFIFGILRLRWLALARARAYTHTQCKRSTSKHFICTSLNKPQLVIYISESLLKSGTEKNSTIICNLFLLIALYLVCVTKTNRIIYYHRNEQNTKHCAQRKIELNWNIYEIARTKRDRKFFASGPQILITWQNFRPNSIREHIFSYALSVVWFFFALSLYGILLFSFQRNSQTGKSIRFSARAHQTEALVPPPFFIASQTVLAYIHLKNHIKIYRECGTKRMRRSGKPEFSLGFPNISLYRKKCSSFSFIRIRLKRLQLHNCTNVRQPFTWRLSLAQQRCCWNVYRHSISFTHSEKYIYQISLQTTV